MSISGKWAAISSAAVGNGCVYVTAIPGGLWVVPVPGAKPPARPKGVLPANAEFREKYRTDEIQHLRQAGSGRDMERPCDRSGWASGPDNGTPHRQNASGHGERAREKQIMSGVGDFFVNLFPVSCIDLG